ncbi:hypothetical protein JI435_412930 [Parastagonospora nodorum SN15]|uniref:Uncharacterized protein n=1 Tax=Phaeosphaeria nodorum (strain SN15 / ATCC MYA-4574 / FGSC 10173) TaxID=321614 RepID=A0A7U2F5B2_PHANO|nr:hypothetical protein JI435_412930 [Parastagonospora nodorum SN15]
MAEGEEPGDAVPNALALIPSEPSAGCCSGRASGGSRDFCRSVTVLDDEAREGDDAGRGAAPSLSRACGVRETASRCLRRGLRCVARRGTATGSGRHSSWQPVGSLGGKRAKGDGSEQQGDCPQRVGCDEVRVRDRGGQWRHGDAQRPV